MSITQKKIIATDEELKILREKLNAISDIPYEKGVITHSNNQSIPNTNKDIVISQLTQKVNELKNALSKNSFKISNNDQIYQWNFELREQQENAMGQKMNSSINKKIKIPDDYLEGNSIANDEINESNQSLLLQITKLKSENILLNQKIKEQAKIIFEYEKQKEIAQYILNSESNPPNIDYIKISLLCLINKNKLDEKCQDAINQLFKKDKQSLVQFLFNRINSLEYQNYSLISLIEYYIDVILHLTEEVSEYIDVICDIRNVLNSVPSNTKLNDDFFIIRDTLNKKEYILSQQKESVIERKNKIVKNDVIQKNLAIILCKDKISEAKVKFLQNNQPLEGNEYEKCIEVINEKISELEAKRDMMSKYEDYIEFMQSENGNMNEDFGMRMKYKEEINFFNSYLKENNIKMRNIIIELIKHKDISISEDLMERINKVLNKNNSAIEIYDNMIELMKIQGMILENSLMQ